MAVLNNMNKQQKENPMKEIKNKFKGKNKMPNIFLTILIILTFIIIAESIFKSNPALNDKKSFTEVIKLVEEDKIEKIQFDNSNLTVIQKQIEGEEKTEKEREIKALIPANTQVLDYFNQKGIDKKVQNIEYKEPFDFWMIFGNILNLLIFGIFLYFIINLLSSNKGSGIGGAGGIFGMGKSRAKLFEENKDKDKRTSFKNVAMDSDLKNEFMEVVDFLKNAKKYQKMGARIPKGVLLVGPAGVGKTLMARAVAGEAKVPFYSASGSEFMEMFVGVGSSRVRDLFKKAREQSPSLIFIDEIDAIGRQRGSGVGGGHDEREQTLNQILVEMDGFDNQSNVIVIAATNRPDMLDPALVRPGRFDRKITLQLPTLEEREDIVKIHMGKKPFGKDVTNKKIAKRTVGFSGADIENMLNEAAILAVRGNKKEILFKDISEAITKVKLGPERKKLQDKNEKRTTAYHEAGHAVVAYYCKSVDPVRLISIVARTRSLGHTDISGDKEVLNYTKDKLLETIAVFYGGRVAEEIFFNQQSAGASNDIERASDLARKMVTELGMSSLGPINYSTDVEKSWMARQMGASTATVSENTLQKIDEEVYKILTKAKNHTEDILNKNKDILKIIAEKLIEVENIEEDEFITLMEKGIGKNNKEIEVKEKDKNERK